MIFGLFLLAFCACAQAHLSAQEIAALEGGTIVPSRPAPALKASAQSSLVRGRCDKDHIICIDDQLIFCAPAGYDVVQTCYVDGKKGYCNCAGDGCSAVAPTEQECPKSTIRCYTPGTKFPVPYDCNRFTYCDDQYVETTIACPSNWVYNPRGQKCEPKGTCAKIACDNYVSVPYYLPFPQAPEYYLFCYSGSGYLNRVSKCSQQGYGADERSGCTFLCEKDGMFQDPDPEKCLEGIHWACSKQSNGTFLKEKLQCRPGKYFDNSLNMCTATAKCPR